MIKTGGNSRGGSSPFVPSLGFLALLVAHIVLPFASPFAVGTYASTTSATTNLGASSALHHLRPPGLGASSGLTATLTADEIQASGLQQRSPLLSRVLSHLNPAGSRNASTAWKSGEYNATLVSKLLFSYLCSELCRSHRELRLFSTLQRKPKLIQFLGIFLLNL